MNWRILRAPLVVVSLALVLLLDGACSGGKKDDTDANTATVGNSVRRDSAGSIGRRPSSVDENREELLWMFGDNSATRIITLERRFQAISTMLPTSNERFTSIERDSPWAAWAAASSADVGPDASEMGDVLAAPATLEDGTELTQEFNEQVGRMTSAAACTAGGRRIFYDPHAITGLLPPGLRFIKAHELGHFALRHIDCGRSPQILANYREKDADCWAVRQLLRGGGPGKQAIDMAAAFFQTQSDAAVGAYESAKDRASYLYHRCR